jgi:hypothetical protein
MKAQIEAKARYLSAETGLHAVHCKSLLNTRDDLDLLSTILKLGGQSIGRKRKLFHLAKRLKRLEPFFEQTSTIERSHANGIV